MQAANNCFRHFFGFGGLYLAFNRRVLKGAIIGCHFGLCPRNPLCIDDHVGLCRIPGRRNCNVGGAKNNRKTGNQSDEAPLAAKEIANLEHG
jgi:hypothetical protein